MAFRGRYAIVDDLYSSAERSLIVCEGGVFSAACIEDDEAGGPGKGSLLPPLGAAIAMAGSEEMARVSELEYVVEGIFDDLVNDVWGLRAVWTRKQVSKCPR